MLILFLFCKSLLCRTNAEVVRRQMPRCQPELEGDTLPRSRAGVSPKKNSPASLPFCVFLQVKDPHHNRQMFHSEVTNESEDDE